MNLIPYLKKFVHYLKIPFIAIPLVALVLALILNFVFTKDIGFCNFLIIAVVAFLASDILSLGLTAGGGGIFQFSPIGTQTLSKGYAFIIYFFIIIVVAYVVNLATSGIVVYISSTYSDFLQVFVVCLILAVLVYLDMHVRFFKKR